MISLLSIIALIPLAASAARIPHHLHDLDASVVLDTKSALGLDIVPRAPHSTNLISERDNPLDILNNGPLGSVTNLPILSDVVGSVATLLPDIDAGVSFCITLAADAHLVDGSLSVFLAAGICLCVDADVEIHPSSHGITVQASTGAVYEGAFAVKLRNSIVNCMRASPHTGSDYFALSVGADVCLQLDLFIGFTQHDFSANVPGVGRCCARKCTAPYINGPGKSCVCPAANMCGGKCFSGPTVTCSGTCYLASEYTCPTNIPNPVPVNKIEPAVPRRRSEIPFGKCSFGQQLCPVATSSGYECVNTISDMESCGGCVHAFRGTGKQGQDCTAIPNVDEVICNRGQCQVQSCEEGYRSANNATICVSESRLQATLAQSALLQIQALKQ